MKTENDMEWAMTDYDFEGLQDLLAIEQLTDDKENMDYEIDLLNRGIIKNLERKSFAFHPSFLSAYKALKQVNQEWAVIYIEALMGYGVDRNCIPQRAKEIPLVEAFLEGNIKTIDKNHRSYVAGLEKARKSSKKYFKQKRSEF